MFNLSFSSNNLILYRSEIIIIGIPALGENLGFKLSPCYLSSSAIFQRFFINFPRISVHSQLIPDSTPAHNFGYIDMLTAFDFQIDWKKLGNIVGNNKNFVQPSSPIWEYNSFVSFLIYYERRCNFTPICNHLHQEAFTFRIEFAVGCLIFTSGLRVHKHVLLGQVLPILNN